MAVGLIKGGIVASDYEDADAADPRTDALRAKIEVVEEPRYSCDYRDPDKRSSANAVQARFTDGSTTRRIEVEYPTGHPARRECLPVLLEKFERNVRRVFPAERSRRIVELCLDRSAFERTAVCDFMDEVTL